MALASNSCTEEATDAMVLASQPLLQLEGINP
jgi:hypothetical protein